MISRSTAKMIGRHTGAEPENLTDHPLILVLASSIVSVWPFGGEVCPLINDTQNSNFVINWRRVASPVAPFCVRILPYMISAPVEKYLLFLGFQVRFK